MSTGAQPGAGGGAGGGASKLAEVIVGQGGVSAPAATIDFTNIPSTSRHLQLLIAAHGTVNGMWSYLRFNNDAGATSYWSQWLSGNAASPGAGSENASWGRVAPHGVSGPTATPVIVWIPNYALATSLLRGWLAGGSDGRYPAVTQTGGNWAGSAAISRITILADSGGLFAADSYFGLYGL